MNTDEEVPDEVWEQEGPIAGSEDGEIGGPAVPVVVQGISLVREAPPLRATFGALNLTGQPSGRALRLGREPRRRSLTVTVTKDPSAVDFTATITKTAVASQWQVALNPSTGTYEFSVDFGAYSVMTNGGTFTVPSTSSTVIIRETSGLRRTVTILGVSNAAATGSVLSGTSSSADAYVVVSDNEQQAVTGYGLRIRINGAPTVIRYAGEMWFAAFSSDLIVGFLAEMDEG